MPIAVSTNFAGQFADDVAAILAQDCGSAHVVLAQCQCRVGIDRQSGVIDFNVAKRLDAAVQFQGRAVGNGQV